MGSGWRCQLHAHTTNSDGEPTPEGLVEHYARAGYDVLAITDHWHVTRFEHEGVLVLPSAELSGRIEGELDEADVLAYGIDELYGSSGPEIHDLRLAGDGVQAPARPLARLPCAPDDGMDARSTTSDSA